MEQEAAYIEALMNVSQFQLMENRLEIKSETGNVILIFESK